MSDAAALEKIRIKKVLGPINTGTAVLLGNEEKTFVMFIGPNEGAALLRELNHETPPRPMTHDLLSYILAGFEVKIKQVIISDIVDNTFCATLVLEQLCRDGEGDWNGKRNEVRIDARPSDCLVLALKEQVEVFATRSVMERVQDVSEGMSLGGGLGPQKPQNPFGLKELDLTGFKDQFGSFELGEEEDEDADE